MCNEQTENKNKKTNPILKNNLNNKRWARGMAQVVEHLPSKCEALSSNPPQKKSI
jgi:hypothetical protein